MSDDGQRCSRCEHWERATAGQRGYCQVPLAAYLLRSDGEGIPSSATEPDDGEDCRAFRALPALGAVSVTHALIMPWALSREPRSWCGRLGGYIAIEPEAVDCPECIRVMRFVHASLASWMPRLKDAGRG